MADRNDPTGSARQRRRLLQAGLGAAALGAIPGAGQLAAQAQGAFDWKRFKGEKIDVFLVKSPRGDLLTKYHKEFEDLTGITVGSEMIPEQQQRQKAVIEFNSGNTSFDVIALSLSRAEAPVRQEQVDGRRAPAGRRQVADRSRTSTSPISPRAAWPGPRRPTARIDSLPLQHRSWMIYYNKELFDAKGVAYPKSFAEIVDAAAKLNDPAKGVSGFVARGLKNANVPVWTSFAAGLRRRLRRRQRQADDRRRRGDRRGEDVPDAARQDTGRRASPASTGTSARASSCRARPRCGSTASASRTPLEDPTKSRIVGKVGYGVMPPGRRRSIPAMFGDGDGHLVVQQEEGAGLALPAVGVEQDEPARAC